MNIKLIFDVCVGASLAVGGIAFLVCGVVGIFSGAMIG